MDIQWALQQESPLQLVGVLNPISALLAQQAGFKALYLSGAGVANCDFGLPDLGLTSLNDVVDVAKRITDTTSLPLIVDADTGWGSSLNVSRSFRQLSLAACAGAHIEDQDGNKRCGHRDGKLLVSKDMMVQRIYAALEGRSSDDFWVIARTDALAVEGFDLTMERALAYQEAGADALFLEAAQSLEDYQQFTKQLTIPVIANITEFGKTPLYTAAQLKKAGIKVALHPLSAARAMYQAAANVFKTLRKEGTVESQLPQMLSRDDLYTLLNYEKIEKQLDSHQKPLREK